MDETYWKLERDGKLIRVTKINSGGAYTYENGEWVEYPSMIRILYEDTDFDPITKEDAERLIEANKDTL